MAPYHAVLVHFPVALWTTAVLAFLIRALSDGPFAKAIDRALVPLLLLGALAGAVAYLVGLLVWPWETITSSPLGRNHLLAASWTLAYWILLLVTRWIKGESVWDGANRWIMLGLAALGGLLLTVTGTLGGHIAGNPTAVSQVLRFLGWEVYTTYYLPDVTLWLLLAAMVVLLIAALWGRKLPG